MSGGDEAEEYLRGFDYVSRAAYTAALAALAATRNAESAPEATEPWSGEEPGRAFGRGAADALSRVADVEPDESNAEPESDEEKASCPDCGRQRVEAMGGLVCPNCE